MTAALLLAGSSLALAQSEGSTGGGDICPPLGIDAPVADQLAAIQAADTAVVVSLEDCSFSGNTEVVDALMANEGIAGVLQQETVGAGEILGVSVEDGAVTVYVSGDGDDD